MNFLVWHYHIVFRGLLQAWFNFVLFCFHLFSVNLLLKTLFSPWHRVEIASGEPGFSFAKFFEKLTFNFISRMIGFFVRSFFILLGLISSMFFFILGLFIVCLWLFIPFLTWPVYLLKDRKDYKDDDKVGADEIMTGFYKREVELTGKLKTFVLNRMGLKSEEELKTNKVDKKDLKEVIDWYLALKKIKRKKGCFWSKEHLLSLPSMGSDLAFGFTLNLDKHSLDLSFPPPFFHQLVGRKKEVSQIEDVLVRSNQNNVLLVGEPGVGKDTILLGFAKAIKEKKVNPKLFYKRVLKLNMSSLLGQSPNLGEVKSKFENLLKEAESAGNIILVIDNIDKYVSGQEGIDFTPVLALILQNSKIHLIGVTTPANFSRFIFPNQQIMKYFEKVEVSAPGKIEALNILKHVVPDFEKGKVLVTLAALKEIIDKSDSLITNIPFPEKAIDLLDQLVAQSLSQEKSFVTVKDVDKLLSEKTNVPVGPLTKKEIEKLKSLDLILKQRLIGQDVAVSALKSALQRARLNLQESSRPMAGFLFLGPTGVGKTETAKALAESYFGDEKYIVRFDMSQYQDASAVSSLIGSSLTEKPGLLIKEVRQRPFGVLLLDEFEKASPEILNLFLTVLDEGYIKDFMGKKVSFENMVIICTSNAGAEFIRRNVKDNNIDFSLLQTAVLEHVLSQGFFSPELVNRFDGVIIYKPLDLKVVESIAKNLLKKLQDRVAKKGISLSIDNSIYLSLAKIGYSPEFGARPLKRVISEKIESLLAGLILKDELKKGDKVKLTLDLNSQAFKIEKV